MFINSRDDFVKIDFGCEKLGVKGYEKSEEIHLIDGKILNVKKVTEDF